MDELKERESLDVREIDQLDKAFILADSIVTKNYLANLEKCPIVDSSSDLDKIVLNEYASLFNVKKIVYNPDENNLQKLVNVYASVVGFNNSIVMVIHSDGKETSLYLGTVGSQSVDAARASAEALAKNLVGNFPGSISKFKEIVLDNDPLDSLINSVTKELYTSISSVSGIGSPRVSDDVANENYIQGIEKMIDTMQGTPFSAILISNYINDEQVDDIRAEYELLYSKLVPFLKSELSFNESSADGVTKTLSESLSTTLTKSRSSALSTGTMESTSHTDTETRGSADAISANVGGDIGPVKVGGSVSHSVFRSKSWSDTTTFGTTKTQTKTIGDAESKGEIQSIADGTSKTETTGRGLQITYQNKTIQNLLERIDEQLERLKEGENYGVFATAAYFLAADPMATRMAASSYKGLINGNCTHVENAQINTWQDTSSVNRIKSYLRKLHHPMFDIGEKKYVTPASVLSGRELAVHFGLPQKSIPGVSVIESASFGRNVVVDTSKKHRFIDLGSLYNMGRDEEGAGSKIPVKIDLDSLTMHTFITGSTGKGKSNAIYSLLERVLEKNEFAEGDDEITFLVVEPAKGEYKDKFGHYKNVSVYGTNRNKTDILRINPFSFPDDIHVLEHIDRLVEIFNVCWPMYAAMPAILKDAIERSYMNAGWDLDESECKYVEKYGVKLFPTFVDVLDMINIVMSESAYSADSKGDYSGALCTRVRSLTNGIYGQIFTNDELTSKELFDSNVIVDLSRVGSVETKSLIMGLLVMKMQEYRMSSNRSNNSKLRHLTVLEEAHNLLKRTSTEQSSDSSNLLGKSVEMLANSIAEMRTYGEGFVIADQAPGLLDMSTIRNTNTKIILGLPDMSDRELVGRAANLNDSQIIELSRLETGVAAVYQNNWLEPVLCHIYRCEDDEKPYSLEKKIEKSDDRDIRKAMIEYLLLPAPKKLEIDTDKIAQLEESVFKLQVSSDTKVDLLKYFSEKDTKKIQKLRNRIVYNIFNSEMALAFSDIEKRDMEMWYSKMVEKLDPDLEGFNQDYQNKILAIIASEYADRVKTPETREMADDCLKYLSRKVGG